MGHPAFVGEPEVASRRGCSSGLKPVPFSGQTFSKPLKSPRSIIFDTGKMEVLCSQPKPRAEGSSVSVGCPFCSAFCAWRNNRARLRSRLVSMPTAHGIDGMSRRSACAPTCAALTTGAGATKARTLPTFSISFPMISTLRSTLKAPAFCYSAATTIGMEAHGTTWWMETTTLFRKAARPILCTPILNPHFFL